MKAKALKFGKAMSAALFVLLLVVVGTKNALAQNLVATLQHGSDISMYYGSNAFVQAHDAAQTGDIITLSSGTFNPTTITKAITLRGAGCCMDTVTGIYPTVFESSFYANVSDEEHSLTIEGIFFKGLFEYGILYNPKFIKCQFYYFRTASLPSMQNAQFIDCMVNIPSSAFGYSGVYATNTQFINCYVDIACNNILDETHVTFLNSIVKPERVYLGSYSYNYNISGVLAENCIFIGDSYNYEFSVSSSLFYNCVSVDLSNLFDSQMNTTNLEMDNFSDVFETYNGSNISFYNSIYERFILKSDFATSFLGNDGTEVGIHGGEAPYNPRPNYMVLKQCNVANQSTIDGKLSVEIQVVSEGE